jgi:Fur family transcriptional regulator, peroxide stress response regulator
MQPIRHNPRQAIESFREACARQGLAATHQRMVIYRALITRYDHPSPEDVYETVRKEIPSISLGTVYKNIRTFIEHGLLGEVSLHHGTARLEVNLKPHHHLVCLRCKAIVDLEDEDLDPVRLRGRAPEGFQVRRYSVEAIGLCKSCAGAELKKRK